MVYGLYDLLASAGRDWGIIVDGRPGAPVMDPVVVSAQKGAFQASNGVLITPQQSLDRIIAPSIACVPEINIAPGESIAGRFDSEIEWLTRCHANGATLATACSGALMLAEAGLLDGLEATTHWAWCDVMRKQYPSVKVCERRALVVSGEGQRMIMAGAGTSWLDLALYLIGRFAGIDVAMQVARLNLIDWHAIGQQPFALLARSRQVDDAIIGRCQEWIAHHYREAAPVAAMTRLSGLAERTFKRRFEGATGMSPLEYTHTLRLEEAKQMLESTDQSIEAIAHEVGYEDAAFFSRLFRRKVSLSPAQYRRRFGSMRSALRIAG